MNVNLNGKTYKITEAQYNNYVSIGIEKNYDNLEDVLRYLGVI